MSKVAGERFNFRNPMMIFMGAVALSTLPAAGFEAYAAYSANHQAQVAINTERVNPDDNATAIIRADRTSARADTNTAEFLGEVGGGTALIWTIAAAGITLANSQRREDFDRPTRFNAEEA